MMNLSPNSVRPNLPLRRPSTNPVVLCAASPSSGRSALLPTPVRPASFNYGAGCFPSPGSLMNLTANRDKIAPTTPTLALNFCSFCAQQGNFRCKRCKKTAYCSVVCQQEDWKAHRHMCKAIEATPEKDKTLDSSVSPASGDKPGDPNHSDTTSIYRVYMKDLHSKVIKGTEIQAVVVEFHSPGRFFIVAQSNETLETVQMITTELQKTCSSPSATAHTPVVDEVCAVQFSCDMNWYRGLVQNLAADQNTAHILYIDFGNEEKVPFERIKPLTAKLQQFGPCAIECFIAEVVPAADAWSGKCCIAVRKLLERKTLTVKVLDTMQNGLVHAVDIMLSSGNTLSSFLLEQEYAVKEAINKTPTQQDINDIKNASMENFNRHSNGKDDNLWAQVPKSLTQAVGDSFSAVVTHFQSPEKFVVQKVDNAGAIQNLQIMLRDHCNQVPASSYFRPAPGTVCCALFSEDKQWYRAKILAYSSEERVCVGYLDFGNSEDVDLSSLRPITPSLLDVPIQAMTCGLLGVQPVGENWSEECLLALRRRLSNRILRIEIQGPHEGKALVTIIDEASDPQANIAELLITGGFAVPAVVDIRTDQPTELSLPAPEVPVCSSAPEPLVWTCAELPSDGRMVTLRLCGVESPSKFFCQIDNPKDLATLNALEAELKPYCEVESSTFDPKLGEPCCAIIPENSKCFRALVKQLCKDDVIVALVDYGYCRSVKKNHLRPITNKFLTLPFLALPCWLAGVEPQGSKWTSEALLWFQTLENETLSARVLSVTEDGYGVELQSQGQSVAAALVSENLAIFLEEKEKQEAALTPNILNKSALKNKQEQVSNKSASELTPDTTPSQVGETSFPVDWKTVVLPVNETFQPCIAAVSSPSLFYLFGPRQVDEQQLQEMMLQLAKYCNSQGFEPSARVTDRPAAGAACCARFTADNNWYRAVILEVCDQVASVIYADYGNSEKVSLSNILPIPASFLQLPFQVTRCSLIGKDNFPVEWSEDVLQMFLSVLQQGVLATVQSFDGYSNVLALSLPTECGGGLVEAMILDALQAHSKSTTGPVPDITPTSNVSNADTRTEKDPEPSVLPNTPNKFENRTIPQEVQLPLSTAPLGKSTEAVHETPVPKIVKHFEPPCMTDPKTRDSLASSCCCESLKNKIDQLEQIMQEQLSLIKKLRAHTK